MDLIGKGFALMCAFCWGVAVILFSSAGKRMRPLSLNLFKTLVTAFFLFLIMLIWKVPFFPTGVSTSDWVIIALTGFLGITIADSLFFYCLNMLGAGMAAIVDCMYSPMVLLLSWIVLGDRLTAGKTAGVVLVVTAIMVAAYTPGSRSPKGRRALLGILAGAFAMGLMALSIVLMKPILNRTSFLWVTELRLVTAFIFLLVHVNLHSERKAVFTEAMSPRNWGHAFPGALMGNVIAMTLWVAAFKYTDVTSAAILNQTSTIFIVILAAIFLHERFTFQRLTATLLAFAGSIIVILA